MARRRKVELSTIENKVRQLENLLNEDVQVTNRMLSSGEMVDHKKMVGLADKLELLSKKILSIDKQSKDHFESDLLKKVAKRMGGMEGVKNFIQTGNPSSPEHVE